MAQKRVRILNPGHANALGIPGDAGDVVDVDETLGAGAVAAGCVEEAHAAQLGPWHEVHPTATRPEVVMTAAGEVTEPSEDLSSLKLPELRAMAKARGLSTAGNKAALVERLT